MALEGPVVLYGAGREARSTRAFLAARQPETEVFVTVDSGVADIEDTALLSPAELDAAIAEKRVGTIVKSPGVPLGRPVFAAARRQGVPVTSNLNLWAETYRDGRTVIAISGTKGKSTTATLCHLMLVHSGVDAGLAGNVGLAPLEIADRHAVVVFELSSYQTADMAFEADIAGLTNLYPEHVDWHGSVTRYYDDKLNLLSHAKRIGLGRAAAETPEVPAVIGPNADLLPPLPDALAKLMDEAIAGSRLKGAHNRDNAWLAAALALAAGATEAGLIEGIAAFRPLPHRLEEHALGDLLLVDDSISTTPEATKAALAAYPGRRIALIAGGHEREQDYADLANRLAPAGVVALACLPVTGARLARAAKETGIAIAEPETLEAAIDWLVGHRAAYDLVLLSPGAPSYNQFRNFEERGDRFVALAKSRLG